MFAPSVARTASILLLRPDVPLSPGTIASIAGETSRTVTVSALNTLEKQGIARTVTVRGQTLYEPNPDSLYLPMALGVALIDLPWDAAFAGDRLYALYAYGSLTRPGGATPTSDLDVLAIGRFADRAVTRARVADTVGARIGREVDVLFLGPDEAREHADAGSLHLRTALDGVRLRGSFAA